MVSINLKATYLQAESGSCDNRTLLGLSLGFFLPDGIIAAEGKCIVTDQDK